jgi:hypothetical protein
LSQLLDHTSLASIFRPSFIYALLRLARKSELYPQILVRGEITLEGNSPLTAGQYGDVWKGVFAERQVAVKVLKVYLNSNTSKHLKVS